MGSGIFLTGPDHEASLTGDRPMADSALTTLMPISEAALDGAPVQTVNARDLHTFLEVGKDFSTWIKDRIAAYEFTEDQDFVCSPILGSEGRGGHNRMDWFLTLDMAKELAMVERNQKGKEARAYFIECERRAKQGPADMHVILNDPGALRGLLSSYAGRLIEMQEKVDEMVPKVAAHDRIAESFGSTCRRIAAKNLGIPPLVLNRWMRTNGWTYQLIGTKDEIAYQAKINAGLLEHKVETGEKPDGTTWTRTSVRVTPKGMLALAKAFPPIAKVA
jgi:phage anti-repressor protein/phage antirepressor YoqD-like protein